MRFSFLVLFLLCAGKVHADWTGVAVEFADFESDWKFSDGVREAQITSVNFQIEEKTESGLSGGVAIGYVSMRVTGDSGSDNGRFDAEYLQLFLRQEVSISQNVSLHGLFNFSYNTGDDDDADNPADIDWSEASLQIGASYRFTNLRISPFATYYDIDGDIRDNNGTAAFEMDDPVSQGIRFDYYLEPTSFIRFAFQTGAQAGGYLTFANRY